MEKRAGRFVVSLPNWYGSVAKVAINGKPAGFIDAPPWECDVTKWVKRGQNEVEVTVIGTLKNTLGPHHGKPALGSAWPGSFQKGPSSPPPGTDYSTVAYGLFEPFAHRLRRPNRRERRHYHGVAVHDVPRTGAGLPIGRLRAEISGQRLRYCPLSRKPGPCRPYFQPHWLEPSRLSLLWRRCFLPEHFDVEKSVGRFVVALPNWYGSVAKVAVNGKPAGFIDAPPWECDVTNGSSADKTRWRSP